MFKNEYQGGVAVEVFSASGKDPHDKFRNHVKTKFDSSVKGNVYILEGSTTLAKLNFPPSELKQTLGLIQRFLIIQVYVPLSKDFGVELSMTDINNSKRRLMLSTSFKDLSSTPLHAKLPLNILQRDVWLNLCLDLRSFINGMFPNQTFKSLEEFAIGGTCKIRRVFTMKKQPPDTSDFPDEIRAEPLENIPITLQFSSNVNFVTQVISVSKLRKNLAVKDTRNETSDYWSSSSDDLSNIKRTLDRELTHSKIAFGTRFTAPVTTPRSSRSKSGCNSARSERNQQNRLSGNSLAPSTHRKAYSSKARLATVTYETLKDSCERLSSDNQQDPTELMQSEKTVSSIMHNGFKDLDISDQCTNKSPENESQNKVNSRNHSKVFEFSSKPHTLGRCHFSEREENAKNKVFSSTNQHSIISDQIQERINLSTPTPRSGSKSPKGFRCTSMREVKNPLSSKPIHLPSSRSPDLSSSHCGHFSNGSAAFFDEHQNNSEVSDVLKSVVSLKSSDATLTESVDTLIPSSLCASHIEPSSQQHLEDSDTLLLNSATTNQFSSSVTVSHKDVREVSVNTGATPESPLYPVGTWNDSLEAKMLLSMKQEMDEGLTDPGDENEDTSDGLDYQAKFEESFEASWSTCKYPTNMDPQVYDGEMMLGYPENKATINTSVLSKSNPREWTTLISPPLVLPSVRNQQKKESISDAESISNDYDVMGLSDGSSLFSNKSSATTGDTDDEEMLDLLYDPCLNCYFDPRSGKYYELKN